MNIANYKVKDTTKCECGHEFDIHEINGLLPIDNHGFYSNVVRTCSKIYCPKCNKETILLLKQKGQTWEILGIATPKVVENRKKVTSLEVTATKTELNTQYDEKVQTTIENKTENKLSNELICPVCKKVCKSKVGLNAHMRTHNK